MCHLTNGVCRRFSSVALPRHLNVIWHRKTIGNGFVPFIVWYLNTVRTISGRDTAWNRHIPCYINFIYQSFDAFPYLHNHQEQIIIIINDYHRCVVLCCVVVMPSQFHMNSIFVLFSLLFPCLRFTVSILSKLPLLPKYVDWLGGFDSIFGMR